VLLLLAASGVEARGLPATNVVRDAAVDQAAGSVLGIWPLTWGYLVLAACVVGVAGLITTLPHAEGRLPALSRRHLGALRGCVLALGALVYVPGLWGDFNIYDDMGLIFGLEMVTSSTAAGLWEAAFENPGGKSCMELMFISFWFNYLLGGTYYALWYAPNLVLFAMGIGLAIHFVASLTNPSIGWLAGGLLLVNPAMPEIVAWMSARCHLLGCLFTMGSLVAYQRAVTTLEHLASWRDSVTFWERQVRLYPDDGWAHYHLGRALQWRGELERAADRYEYSVTRVPENLEAHLARADVAFDLGRLEEARSSYRRYLSRGGAYTPALRRRIGDLLSKPVREGNL